MKKRFLLDTQAFIIAASENDSLSKKAAAAFINEDHEIFLSAASIWELAIKISLKKLTLPVTLEEAIRIAVTDAGIAVLPIQPKHIFALQQLPFHHRDPFDRMLIAQSLTEDLTILTNDKSFERYEVKTLW